MQVKAVVHEKYAETEIHVCDHEVSENLQKLVEDLSSFVYAGDLRKLKK